jgi:mono/diheme cytochrome c family protein
LASVCGYESNSRWRWGGWFDTPCLAADAPAPEASPLPGNHRLDQVAAGQVLLAELGCAHCHSGLPAQALAPKRGPNLAEVGSRVSPEYLQRYLADPTAVHRGTSMPDVLGARTPAERQAIATALTHFLIARGNESFRSEAGETADRDLGRRLYHTVGCVACHGARDPAPQAGAQPATPRPEPAAGDQPHNADDGEDEDGPPTQRVFRPIALGLEHILTKYSETSLTEFLHEPLAVRSSGRMPDLKLTTDESRALAQYLLGADPPPATRPVAPLSPDPRQVAQGERYFRELHCGNCHALPGIDAAPAVGGALQPAATPQGCLQPQAGGPVRYDLDDAQRQALVAALQHLDQAETDAEAVAKTLVAQRCIACHVRDDYGGVHPDVDPLFTTTEPNLGDEGRLPPPLTLLGAKLQPTWLKKVLFDGESVRPYLGVRMPQYGVDNLGHLPALLARTDTLPAVDWTIPSPERDSDREREREFRKAGHALLGNQGLYCIACHNFNGKEAPVNRGMELTSSYQRLQPAWFNAFLRNPQQFRPRIIMPQSWANGVASHKTILDGDTDRQIQAIWYYLSLGTSAADPPGLKGIDTRLTVGTRARIHRGRSRVAGYRGIAVGFPDQLHYAFNAETGTLSALWRGGFVSANWSGQGSGDFQPAAEPVLLAQDVSLLKRDSPADPWPLLPVMTKENRANPNPLYPKNLGYQFLGYRVDHDGVPTFRYRLGDIEVSDRSVPGGAERGAQLERHLQLKSGEPQTVWFRALTGEISQPAEGVYESGRLRLTVPLPADRIQLRSIDADPPRSELLLRLELPQGTSHLELIYEPLPRK